MKITCYDTSTDKIVNLTSTICDLCGHYPAPSRAYSLIWVCDEHAPLRHRAVQLAQARRLLPQA